MKNNGESHLQVYATSYNETITGSNTIVKAVFKDSRTVNFAIDCGLFQEEGWSEYNNKILPYGADTISFAIATHVHTDHIGRFPYLFKCGFSGEIYTSYETASLFPIMLNETFSQMQSDFNKDCILWRAEVNARKKSLNKGRDKCCLNYDKKKRKKKFALKNINDNKPKMLFDKSDMTDTLNALTVIKYDEGIEITFFANAHINGAVMMHIRIFDDKDSENLFVTGDLGVYNKVTKVSTELVPKEIANKVTTILAESTYGYETVPRDPAFERKIHCEILNDILKKGGTIIYLVNALERSSALLEDLKELQQDERTKEILAKVPIYLDTTLGITCNSKYIKMLGTDFLPANFKVIFSEDREDIKQSRGPKIILCTSPRFTQGSFLNYAKQAIQDPNCAIIFTSYAPPAVSHIIEQDQGYEFQYLPKDNEKIVKRCQMCKLRCYSAHVSVDEMSDFLEQFKNVKTILFNHGTTEGKNANKARFETDSTTTHALLYGRTVVIEKGQIVKVY
jgi:metallo-beta-lactamase family protein